MSPNRRNAAPSHGISVRPPLAEVRHRRGPEAPASSSSARRTTSKRMNKLIGMTPTHARGATRAPNGGPKELPASAGPAPRTRSPSTSPGAAKTPKAIPARFQERAQEPTSAISFGTVCPQPASRSFVSSRHFSHCGTPLRSKSGPPTPSVNS